MQYKCEVCHDSGSKNQTGDYLDCPACDMPHTRKALNDFVKSLGPTHPEDVALAIHQRALSMAPKQEAPEQSAWKVKMMADYAPRAIPGLAPEPFILGNQYRTQGGRLVRFVRIANEGNSYETMADELGHHRYTRRDFGRGTGAAWDDDCVPPLYTAPAPIAAPVAANGALTDEQILLRAVPVFGEQDDRNVRNDELIGFARAILAAAGPDAAQELIASLISLWDSKHLLADDYIEQMSAIEQKMRALSGAKGN